MIERGRHGFHSWLATTARKFGWRVAHHKTGGRKHAPDADTKGFPDFVMIRGERVLWVECKGDKGTLSDEQREWFDALMRAGQDVYVWAPRDVEEALAVLSRRP